MENKNDLKQRIYQSLLKHKCTNANLWLELFHYDENSNEKEKLSRINSFWRFQLSAIGKNLIDVKSNLIENIEFQDWLEKFEQNIIPYIKKNHLPKIIDLSKL